MGDHAAAYRDCLHISSEMALSEDMKQLVAEIRDHHPGTRFLFQNLAVLRKRTALFHCKGKLLKLYIIPDAMEHHPHVLPILFAWSDLIAASFTEPFQSLQRCTSLDFPPLSCSCPTCSHAHNNASARRAGAVLLVEQEVKDRRSILCGGNFGKAYLIVHSTFLSLGWWLVSVLVFAELTSNGGSAVMAAKRAHVNAKFAVAGLQALGLLDLVNTAAGFGMPGQLWHSPIIWAFFLLPSGIYDQ